MSFQDSTSEEELESFANSGDKAGIRQVIERYRGRLKRMVAVRIDPRLSARVDPSDIVQEAIMNAESRLSEYLKERPLLSTIGWGDHRGQSESGLMPRFASEASYIAGLSLLTASESRYNRPS